MHELRELWICALVPNTFGIGVSGAHTSIISKAAAAEQSATSKARNDLLGIIATIALVPITLWKYGTMPLQSRLRRLSKLSISGLRLRYCVNDGKSCCCSSPSPVKSEKEEDMAPVIALRFSRR